MWRRWRASRTSSTRGPILRVGRRGTTGPGSFTASPVPDREAHHVLPRGTGDRRRQRIRRRPPLRRVLPRPCPDDRGRPPGCHGDRRACPRKLRGARQCLVGLPHPVRAQSDRELPRRVGTRPRVLPSRPRARPISRRSAPQGGRLVAHGLHLHPAGRSGARIAMLRGGAGPLPHRFRRRHGPSGARLRPRQGRRGCRRDYRARRRGGLVRAVTSAIYALAFLAVAGGRASRPRTARRGARRARPGAVEHPRARVSPSGGRRRAAPRRSPRP